MINLQTEVPVFAAGGVSQPLQRLAKRKEAHPTFTRFFDAYRAMQADDQAQSLLARLRTQQYQGTDEAERLLQQFYARPTVKAYQAAEEALHDLVVAIDETISEAAGISFAVNARRSCCGG